MIADVAAGCTAEHVILRYLKCRGAHRGGRLGNPRRGDALVRVACQTASGCCRR